MILDPRDAQHALQIAAGKTGRQRGHEFEAELASMINVGPLSIPTPNEYVFKGLPHTALVNKALAHIGWKKCDSVNAISLGSLATALDNHAALTNRRSDPRRYFWEEIDQSGRLELEGVLTNRQDDITRLLLQKAYLDDPFAPELLIHKTKKIDRGDQEYALYTIDELISLSKQYGGFNKKIYSVHKGQYKDAPGVEHEAPRFGIIQMQRGGQKQHPAQLQFNLQAGYFYKI